MGGLGRSRLVGESRKGVVVGGGKVPLEDRESGLALNSHWGCCCQRRIGIEGINT